jgi:hypothetical protein
VDEVGMTGVIVTPAHRSLKKRSGISYGHLSMSALLAGRKASIYARQLLVLTQALMLKSLL